MEKERGGTKGGGGFISVFRISCFSLPVETVLLAMIGRQHESIRVAVRRQ